VSIEARPPPVLAQPRITKRGGRNDCQIYLLVTVNTYLDAVPKAVTQACSMPLKKSIGFLRVITAYIMKRVPTV